MQSIENLRLCKYFTSLAFGNKDNYYNYYYNNWKKGYNPSSDSPGYDRFPGTTPHTVE